MAVLFLLLAIVVLVVLAAAGLENTDPASATLLSRSFGQLSEGQLLLVAAALGFLVALFLFLAFGSSRTRRSRRRELKSRRRDAEGRVEELERENARLRQELTGVREELETTERTRADAVTERDRAEAAVDRVRQGTAANRDRAVAAGPTTDQGATAIDSGATAIDDHRLANAPTAPPTPTSASRERLDDRTDVAAAHDEHARAADEHARAAEEHARAAADEDVRRR
jgi:TolA-binding protein